MGISFGGRFGVYKLIKRILFFFVRSDGQKWDCFFVCSSEIT